MSGMMAYCGLMCQTCPIHVATLQENKEEQKKMREEIARLCRENYGMQCEPDDITDCDGCTSAGGRLFLACRNCLVRQCARQRRLENCAYCTDYVCAQLEAVFVSDPAAKQRLEQIRNHIA